MSVVFMASIASSYPLHHLTKPSPMIHSPSSSTSSSCFSVTHQFLPPRQERTPTSCFAKFGVSLRIRHGNKGRSMNSRYRVVYASLFGVGAPEALVIGVVALLVFGPKGLAEVARNLGKTLRAFRPTIQELQEVSRDFRSTLEREIGLDDVSASQNSSFRPTSPYASPNPSATTDKNGPVTTGKPYSAEEYLKVTEDQLRAVASDQQGGTTPITSTDTNSTITEVPSNVSPPANSPDQNGNR